MTSINPSAKDKISNQLDRLRALIRGSTNGSTKISGRTHVKKRHWVLGTMVVLVGSWITHTTTATIQYDAAALQFDNSTFSTNSSSALSFASLQSSADVEADEAELSVEANIETATLDPEANWTVDSHGIKRGETLGQIFKKRGYDLGLPHYISKHPIAKELVSLSIGKKLEFKFDESGALRRISYPINSLQNIEVEVLGQDVLSAEIVDLEYVIAQREVSGEITSSLYESALEAGLSINLIMEMVRIFGWDIDFVLDIRQGDSFHVIYSEYLMGEEKLSDGNILAAEFTTQGETYQAIRFEDSEGNVSFYSPNGDSMLGTFLRSPVEFSRISSRFGKRKHPISKKWKAHKGVDYAAPRGTPIRATADGKVVLAGRKGGYGKTVVLRHAGRFSTLYAHMNGYAKGIRSGARVKQGQTIGYVGTTGMSTGPHLHYEFRLDGVHRNPLTYKTPKASSVPEADLARFNVLTNGLVARLDEINKAYQVAKAEAAGATL